MDARTVRDVHVPKERVNVVDANVVVNAVIRVNEAPVVVDDCHCCDGCKNGTGCACPKERVNVVDANVVVML
ncbi:hypothetical protein FGIG_00558 [Fasciola gigantica]|uniref:Metallothionein n=1 Tax=Fasciola gigantica TaxID=46835 RepID=A0A504YTX5_FASGI|nr:hypothetical protein FGIG_00558 [Fasciola gigantica]